LGGDGCQNDKYIAMTEVIIDPNLVEPLVEGYLSKVDNFWYGVFICDVNGELETYIARELCH
tara:strand:+ start:18 stop:203 length:186 start_codon:yes stop_codon:yes gene_type:complete